jgi:hypothetical protein
MSGKLENVVKLKEALARASQELQEAAVACLNLREGEEQWVVEGLNAAAGALDRAAAGLPNVIAVVAAMFRTAAFEADIAAGVKPRGPREEEEEDK